MFNQTITIYNLLKARTGDKYIATVIKQAHWESSQGIKLGSVSVSTDDSIEVVIPFDTKGYVSPSQFKGDKDTWTLSNDDFIVKGIGPLEITDYTDLKKLDEKMVISSWEVNDQARIKRLNNFTARGK